MLAGQSRVFAARFFFNNGSRDSNWFGATDPISGPYGERGNWVEADPASNAVTVGSNRYMPPSTRALT